MKVDFFENTQIAFRLKSTLELKKAYWLFKLIQYRFLVGLGKVAIQAALNLRLPIEGLIKATVFNQFCSGTSAMGSQKVVARLSDLNIASVLAYSVEGLTSEAGFDESLKKTLETLEVQANNPNHPYGVFKPTAIGAFSLFQKVSEGAKLTVQETSAWHRVRDRFSSLCEHAIEWKIRLFIDAEESWIQPAIDKLAETAMLQYNKNELWIVTTVQMYRHDRLAYLNSLVKKGKKEGFHVGVKLVRGAYIEKETLRSQKMKYPNPLCISKTATDKNFDTGVAFLIDHLEHCTLFMGSHNEKSITTLIELLQRKKISSNHPNVWFGQLYGMSDHLSFNLAEAGYNVAKYIPFGPVREVMPYLIRRAEENTSVAGQSSRELELISKELKRRQSKVV